LLLLSTFIRVSVANNIKLYQPRALSSRTDNELSLSV